MAADEHDGDALPGELDVTAVVGPYVFPDNARRRTQGVIYGLTGLVMAAVWATRRGGVVGQGWLVVAVVLGLLAAYCCLSAKPLEVREIDALAAAAREVGFPVGHASAQMAWRGLRSVPTWRILVFSADEPPARRALVLVDGHDGTVLGSLVQDNQDDWPQP